MRVTRRNFLKAAAIGAGSVAFAGYAVPEKELKVESAIRPPEDYLTGFETYYATTCKQCDSGCGLIVRVFEGRAKKAEGNPDHPVSQGKSCVRGQATVQGVYHPDRIRTPLKRSGPRGSGKFDVITWDAAYKEVSDKLKEVAGKNSAVILTDTMRGFEGAMVSKFGQAIGADVMAFQGLEQTVLQEAVRRVYGQDNLPDFDIQNAKYILSFGADFLHTWLSPVQYGHEYGEFRQGSATRGALVQIDPERMSGTGANADEWVPVNPGSEGALAYSIAQVIIEQKLAVDTTVATGLGNLDSYKPEVVSPIVGLPAERIKQIAQDFAKTQPSLALPGGTAVSHAAGLQNAVAILALNRLMGNTNRSGGVRFNPAAPVTALAKNPVRVGTFNDWIRMANRMDTKAVQVALISGANPVYGLPAVVGMKDALARVGYIVSMSTMLDETAAMADIILPSHHPLEAWGSDVPNPGPGYQVISFQQPAINPVFDTRALGDIFINLATALGGAAKQVVPWESNQAMIQDGAQQLFTAVSSASGQRGSVKAADFQNFWIGVMQRGGWWDTASGVTGTSGFPAMTAAPGLEKPTFDGDPKDFPFPLVVFESLAMGAGEGSSLPWLQAVPDPMTSASWQAWVEISPSVAHEQGLVTGDMVTVESSVFAVEAPVYVNPAISHSVVAMPTGEGHTASGRYAAGRGSNVLSLLAPVADATTGALAWSATRVRLKKTGGTYQIALYEGSDPPVLQEELEIYPVSKS